jgi:DNA-binding Lrp family transcriptional regulator
MRARHWKPFEDELLRESFSTQSYAEIANKLGRHRATVRRRSRTLGLRHDKERAKLFYYYNEKVPLQVILQPHGLNPDAKPLSSDDQERWWRRQREKNKQFLTLLRKEAELK